MKIAIVQDHLCCIGGSERIFQYLCEEFPEADAYTLAYNPSKTCPFFLTRKINTTWLNKFLQSMEAVRWSFPLATYAMQSIDLSKYDIVISSSATVAKYVLVPNGKHICYCYLPTRALWHFDQYFGNSIKAKLVKPILPYLKKRDYTAAQKVDHFIAISNSSREYIKQYYDRDAEVIYCPIETDKFYSSERKGSHYLIISRLQHWKKIDYAIEAFNKLGLPLRIIGTGKEESTLRSMAKSNIIFLGAVDDKTLAHEYSEARAVIFTPFLEYGLIPLEANASGTPVICYGKGGITETMIPAGNRGALGESPTAVFFYEQTADALITAIRQFETCKFKNADLVKHAAKWSVASFKEKIRGYITQIYKNNE
jgi:glycosyltransferase involved in cell wall biosynthesis